MFMSFESYTQYAASMVNIFQHSLPKPHLFLFEGTIPSLMCPEAVARDNLPMLLVELISLSSWSAFRDPDDLRMQLRV